MFRVTCRWPAPNFHSRFPGAELTELPSLEVVWWVKHGPRSRSQRSPRKNESTWVKREQLWGKLSYFLSLYLPTFIYSTWKSKHCQSQVKSNSSQSSQEHPYPSMCLHTKRLQIVDPLFFIETFKLSLCALCFTGRSLIWMLWDWTPVYKTTTRIHG